jgi:ubiquinone/menaquinone biosynthesis C-methylase UbiE
MTTTFDDVADSYDKTFRDRRHRAEDAATRRMIRCFIDDADVLDVGCGTGLGLTMGTPRSYLGVDPCPRMIAKAWRRVAVNLYREDTIIDLATSTAEAIQPPPAVYDTILCLWSWPYIQDRERCLRSWFRALRANGRVIIVAWDDRYQPSVPIPWEASTAAETSALATRYGFQPWTLGGLSQHVARRALARALPVTLGSRIVETGPEAAAWLLRLERPRIGDEPAGRHHHNDNGNRAPRRMDLARCVLDPPRTGWPDSPTSMPASIAPLNARRLIWSDGGWDTIPPPADAPRPTTRRRT